MFFETREPPHMVLYLRGRRLATAKRPARTQPLLTRVGDEDGAEQSRVEEVR